MMQIKLFGELKFLSYRLLFATWSCTFCIKSPDVKRILIFISLDSQKEIDFSDPVILEQG